MPESDWSPPIASLLPEAVKLISQDLNYLDKEFKFVETVPNLNADETKALKELMMNNNIVIKPDKGSSISQEVLFAPKIHKEPEKWSKPHEIHPGRPIVSNCGSETYYTAEFIDHHLHPLSIRHQSYIKDTYDFIKGTAMGKKFTPAYANIFMAKWEAGALS
ncbi:hypothetical protein CCH79_00015972, partial [Gambusia affinis]